MDLVVVSRGQHAPLLQGLTSRPTVLAKRSTRGSGPRMTRRTAALLHLAGGARDRGVERFERGVLIEDRLDRRGGALHRVLLSLTAADRCATLPPLRRRSFAVRSQARGLPFVHFGLDQRARSRRQAFCRSGGSWLYQTLLTMVSETIGHKCVSRRFGATSWYLNATNTPRTALTPIERSLLQGRQHFRQRHRYRSAAQRLDHGLLALGCEHADALPEKPGRLVTGVLNTMAAWAVDVDRQQQQISRTGDVGSALRTSGVP